MKRLLALLLCLSLFLPVFALGEEEDDWSMQEEDVELDENGNLIIRDEDTGEAFVIKTGTETEEELIELMDAETFLTPDECLKYGFIDEVNRQEDPDDEDDKDDDEVTDPAADPDPDDDPDDDDDEQEAVKQLRQVKKQLDDISRRLKTTEPAKPMEADRVQNLVSNYFK